MKKQKVLTMSAVTILSGAMLAGCGNSTSHASKSSTNNTSNSKNITLHFMFWGSPFEKKIQQQQAQAFSKKNPGITVKPQIIPSNFQTKLNTLMAAGNLPDMSYLGSDQALIWGTQGHILNIAPYVKKDPSLQNWIPEAYIHWAPGKETNLSTLENENLYYNPSIFKKAHISPPPDQAQNAWTWSEFVKVAEKLTVDDHGKHPGQPGFDPKHIVQYGFNMPLSSTYIGWYNYLLSAGGSITNAAGTKYTMNSPAAIQAFQDLHDLIWKYHVMPTPAQAKNLPGTDQALQTGKYAMIMDGQWMLLDFNQKHLKFGIGVLPKIKKPATFLFSGAQPIYSSTKHPNAAIEFLKFETNPLSQLVQQGLWMPLQKKYYTSPSLLKKWAYNSAHPEPQFKDAVVNTVLNYSHPDPGNVIKNFTKIDSMMEQKLSLIWDNRQPVKKVLDEIGTQAKPMLQGVYPSK